MTIKLNDLATSNILVPLHGTFQALTLFAEEFSANSGLRVPVGTLAAGLDPQWGAREFYSPVLPRGLRLNTAEEVRAADLDVQYVQVEPVEVGDPDLIVTGHAGTREVLVERFPSARVLVGNVAPEDITGKVVAGTLPPHLVALTEAYVPVNIRGFDYSRDGDLVGDELRERLVIGEPVKVTVS